MLVVLAWACADERATPPLLAPVSPRAAWLLEPARLGAGQITTLELAVVTPPGHTIAPYTPPPAPPGFALLGSEALPVEEEDARWIHRTRLRLRALAPGEYTWPASTITLEADDGRRTALALPEHPIHVVSILPDYPDRVTTFEARGPAAPEVKGGPVWAPALLGAATALGAVGLVALARRRRRANARQEPLAPPTSGPPAWVIAREELEAARARSDAEPFVAAHGISLALRRFFDRRFGAASAPRTIEELRGAEPPFSARSRWPELIAILSELDAQRFRPAEEPEARAALAARLTGLIEDATRLVEDAVPPEERR
jgi:hypothetical protein